MKTDATELKDMKFYAIPANTLIVALANHEVMIPDEGFSEELKAHAKKLGVRDIPIIFLDDLDDLKFFTVDCPICGLFLEVSEDVTETRPDPK